MILRPLQRKKRLVSKYFHFSFFSSMWHFHLLYENKHSGDRAKPVCDLGGMRNLTVQFKNILNYNSQYSIHLCLTLSGEIPLLIRQTLIDCTTWTKPQIYNREVNTKLFTTHQSEGNRSRGFQSLKSRQSSFEIQFAKAMTNLLQIVIHEFLLYLFIIFIIYQESPTSK